jgi:AcrR family transcriptional regulator
MARAGLTRDAVIDAALALADGDGLAAVSMRRVASDLGVEAMSLYNHIADKQDLHTGLADRVWSEVDLARDEPDWRRALHRLCGSTHAALLRHPWFFSLPLAEGGPTRLAVIEATLAHIAAGGIGADAAFHALHVLDGHVYGYTWQALEFAPSASAVPEPDALEQMLAPYPHLRAHAQQHFDGAPAGDGFVIGLDLILDGLAAGARTTGSTAVAPGRYRHFKGGEYEVVSVARHSETEAEHVVYRALYGEGGVWVRPVAMWIEYVERDDYSGPRFTRVDPPAVPQADQPPARL